MSTPLSHFPFVLPHVSSGSYSLLFSHSLLLSFFPPYPTLFPYFLLELPSILPYSRSTPFYSPPTPTFPVPFLPKAQHPSPHNPPPLFLPTLQLSSSHFSPHFSPHATCKTLWKNEDQKTHVGTRRFNITLGDAKRKQYIFHEKGENKTVQKFELPTVTGGEY